MSTQSVLTALFRYKAWANSGLVGALTLQGHGLMQGELATAIRILDHAHVVEKIFAAHLQRLPHAYTATEPDQLPDPDSLFNAIMDTDRWYIGYVSSLGGADLAESIEFRFTDGDPGRMSRGEMLGHVITHSGYHRGEIGRLLTQLTGSSPRDKFTSYLHEVEPARRKRSV